MKRLGWLPLLALLATPPAAVAQSGTAAAPAPSPDRAPNWADYELDPVEPDFNVVSLPTTLRLPRHKLAFRVTHRFARGLGEGDFGALAGDLFGLDGGAQIGMGLRFGLFESTQFEVYRTSDRTIQFQLDRSLLQQGRLPVGLSVRAGVEGRDNFSEDFSPNAALVISRRVGRRLALYAAPSWVGNARLGSDDQASLVLGVGGRVLLGAGVSVAGEWHPRVAGLKDRNDVFSLAVEKQLGGHVFQLNVSSDLPTTPGQIARGQQGPEDLFIGFNISRKFY